MRSPSTLSLVTTRQAASRIDALLHKLTELEEALLPSPSRTGRSLSALEIALANAKRSRSANVRALETTDKLLAHMTHS